MARIEQLDENSALRNGEVVPIDDVRRLASDRLDPVVEHLEDAFDLEAATVANEEWESHTDGYRKATQVLDEGLYFSSGWDVIKVRIQVPVSIRGSSDVQTQDRWIPMGEWLASRHFYDIEMKPEERRAIHEKYGSILEKQDAKKPPRRSLGRQAVTIGSITMRPITEEGSDPEFDFRQRAAHEYNN